MPTRKKAPQTRKASTKRKATARVSTGAVPPYGPPIFKAIARGDVREMKALATSTRKYLAEVKAALAKLDASIKNAGG